MKVANDVRALRELLTAVYVAVTAHLPLEGDDREEIRLVPEKRWDELCTTLLDASEGREFEPLELPWP